MGKPKMALTWGETTVLGQVLLTIQSAGIEDVLVVTGAADDIVGAIARSAGAFIVHNPDFEAGEMLSSLQVGLRAMPPSTTGALVVLGDQPGIEPSVIRSVIQASTSDVSLVVPSFQRRRGHPWIAGSRWWAEILAMRPPDTLRDFLNRHADEITYVDAGAASVLQDIDTPEDYANSRS